MEAYKLLTSRIIPLLLVPLALCLIVVVGVFRIPKIIKLAYLRRKWAVSAAKTNDTIPPDREKCIVPPIQPDPPKCGCDGETAKARS